MLLATRHALEFTEGVTYESFASNKMMQQAVMRMIQIIGEAARKVSPEARALNPDVPWRRIVGMRHRLVHAYFDIALPMV